MKKIVFTILIILISFLSFGQGKIKKLKIKEEGYNIKIKFEPIVNQIVHDGLTIKITPISSNELNSIFIQENILNGKFEYSHYEKKRDSYFLKKKKKKRKKSDYEFLLEGISWLLDNKNIKQNEYDEFLKRITYNFDPKYNKAITIDKTILCNPYYIGNKYLNLYKIEITNPSQSSITFDENIALECGNNLYNPLNSEYIINELNRNGQMNTYKSLTLKRHNLVLPVTIPPNSTINKYFATLPLNITNEKFTIFFTDYQQSFSWEINKTYKTLDKLYEFYEFNIEYYYSEIKSKDGDNYNILISKHPSSAYLIDDRLFVEAESIDEHLQINTLSLFQDKLYFGVTWMNASSYIDLTKNRKKSIILMTKVIEELKRFEKQ